MIKGDSTAISKSDKGCSVYIGTYESENSRGVYRFRFDGEDGSMTKPELFIRAKNAKWVSLGKHGLAFPVEKNGRAGLGLFELESQKRCELLMEEQTPCYIHQDEQFIYTANYHEGTVMIYSVEQEGLRLIKQIECGHGAGAHQILIHEDYIMVPCLTQHKIRLFDKAAGFVPVGEICFPKGSGPRHGVFNKAHTILYVVSEWSNELFVFQVKGQEFMLKDSLSIFPQNRSADKEHIQAAAAAIHLTNDESFLYISVRDIDMIAVLDVRGGRPSVIQHVSCGGKHPRDFVLSSDERFLLIANRFEGGIVSMERDTGSGRLLDICHRIEMPEGVALSL